MKVFLSHNSDHKAPVEEIARRLRDAGFDPWLDTWNLVPGEAWQPAIEQALQSCRACLVFIGPGGIGSWQNEEMRRAIDRRVNEGKEFPVVPVLLPGTDRPDRSQLPAFLVATTWVEFRETVDDEDVFRRLICGIKGIEPGPAPNETIPDNRCPYRGLEVFEAKHSRFFFGREALTQWLLDELRPKVETNAENRFLAIVGASGSGKSSVARAGLIAAMQDGKIEGSRQWPILICRPGIDPIESIAVAIAADQDLRKSSTLPPVDELIQKLKASHETLHLMTSVALHNQPDSQRLVLLMDQFEEIFTQCTDDSLRRAAIDNLLYASSISQGRTIVVLTMRADFYGKCAFYPELASAVSNHQQLVGPMTDDELRNAIEKPAHSVGCEFERGLVELLIQQVHDQPGTLPLLQYTLEQLWNSRDGRRLTTSTYQDLGGLDGALEKRANEVFAAMTDEQKEDCRRMFLRLTVPGEGTEDTTRRVKRSEFGDSESIEPVLRRLVDARLLIAEGDQRTPNESLIEVSHEALIRGWTRLRAWLDEDRESLHLHSRLRQAALDWAESDRNPALLYRGIVLKLASRWAKQHTAELSKEEENFLCESRRRSGFGRFLVTLILGVLSTAVMVVVNFTFLRFQFPQYPGAAMMRDPVFWSYSMLCGVLIMAMTAVVMWMRYK